MIEVKYPFENVIAVGYWYSKYEPELPNPAPMDYSTRPEYKEVILEYLTTPKYAVSYRGYSGCRVCELRTNGTKDYSDGVYVWPQGLAHYVDKHDTRLPNDFVVHILGFGLHPCGYRQCPRCDAISGDDWSQCEGICPNEHSPHYDPHWQKGDCTEYASGAGHQNMHHVRTVWPPSYNTNERGAFGPITDDIDDIPF